ncbi:beta-ketoacyl-[acyl-carrier-protein] synthase family protein [Nocardia sp. NPDC051570]|uniref:beta-ketoacyl-[acyl-carrier-protein] synthase family protein n=1 Tax=Nocardia sp. NPDC051570 TaxID=3364324 RepID=UPI0037B4C83D
MRIPVITGIGVRAPGSTDRAGFWKMLIDGKPVFRTIEYFDPAPFRSRIAAHCDFDPAAEGLTPREIRRMDRATQFAVAAAREAVADSGLDFAATDPHRVGVSLGSATAAATSLEREYLVLSDSGREWDVDEEHLSPYMFDYLCPAAMPAEVAWAVHAQGPVTLVSDGCTSGIDAVSTGADMIRLGRADIVVAGAAETPITPIVLASFDAIRATTPHNDPPEAASRPFDADRAGFVLAEGAAILVIEDLAAARARGATIYAAIGGYATRLNAYHMTGLRPDGREMAEAIRRALDSARVDPTAVQYINAHGSGTKQNDRHETAAYKRSLGEHAYRVPISSIKSMIGHSLGAIGSIELAASALAIHTGCVPPTANLDTPDPECDLDYVPHTAREQTVDIALSVGSGFGGFQSAMVLRSVEGLCA